MSLRAQLPPLDSLVTFEAAARLLSFTAAAKELNLTQAAVSQQIRNLELRLGLKLFERAHRAVTLTPAGREYQHTVSPLLRTLSSATSDIQFDSARPRLTVAADQAVATILLAPRIHDFMTVNPDFTLRLIASDLEADCLAPDVQVAMLHGDGHWPGFKSVRLFKEEVFPVCSPGYLESAPPLDTANDVAAHKLLHLADDHWHWINWRGWLAANGIDTPALARSFDVNSYPLLIEAARQGQGLALGWGTLIDADLASGQLVRPLEASAATDQDYHMLWRDTQQISGEAKAFCHWIADEFSLRLKPNQFDLDIA